MSKIFEITLPLPEPDNHLYLQKGYMRFMIAKAKKWKENTQVEAKKLWNKKPLECPVWLDVQFFLKRERDIQGSTKLLCDSLEGIVYANDKQITEVTLHKEFNKENPHCIIKVESL
jgi:Holliday junction resolvase RusA-like endonuclease